MLRPIRTGLATLGVSGLFALSAFGIALPAHAENVDGTDDTTVQVVETPKVEDKPASQPAPKPAPDPDSPAESTKEVVTDDSEADADAAAAKLAADEAAAEAAKAKAAAEAKAKAEAEADAAKAAADKAAADAKVATETTDPVVEDPPADEVAGDPDTPVEEVVDPEPDPDPKPPAEPATTSSATACVLNDALIRVIVTTGDDKSYDADVDIDFEQVTPDEGGTVPDTFDIDNDGQQSVKVKVMSDDAPFSGTVNVASSCSGGSGDNGGSDPGDGGGDPDPDPDPAGPLPESVDDVDVSTTVNEQVTFMVAEWGHIEDDFSCTADSESLHQAWGVNPEVYWQPPTGFIGVEEFKCTVKRGDKTLTWNVRVTVTEPDTDGDNVPDKDDVFPNDPKETKDTDKDGVGDNADAFPQDPKESKDSDKDGVGNNVDKCESTPTGESVDANGCSASQRDGDRDGLTDAEEAELGTDPAKADTDGDGYSDGTEVEEGTNPLDPASHPGEVRPPQPESVFTQKTVEDKSCKKGLRTQLQDFVSDPTWVNGAWVFGEPVLLESGPWIKVRSLTKSEKAELKCSVDKDKDSKKSSGTDSRVEGVPTGKPKTGNSESPLMAISLVVLVAVVTGAGATLLFRRGGRVVGA